MLIMMIEELGYRFSNKIKQKKNKIKIKTKSPHNSNIIIILFKKCNNYYEMLFKNLKNKKSKG